MIGVLGLGLRLFLTPLMENRIKNQMENETEATVDRGYIDKYKKIAQKWKSLPTNVKSKCSGLYGWLLKMGGGAVGTPGGDVGT